MNNIKRYSDVYNSLSRNFLEKYYTVKKDQNLVLSPFSILMMLAIAADATAGNTREEIAKVLSADISYEDTTTVLKEIQNAFTETSAFTSANAVCVNNRIENTIVPTYADNLRKKYDGELFSSADIVSDVNQWVKKNTRGMIEKIADESMSNMLACLMNATSFDGKWTKEYTSDDIDYRDFTNSNGTVNEIAMLDTGEDEYIENDSFTGFVKPYKDIGFSFMALLPKKKTVAGMKQALCNLSFSDTYHARTYEEVHVSLPEFKYSFSEDLTSYLKELGVKEIFGTQADFSPLSSAWLEMNAILHKARIEVDRQGTKAAAVTAGMVFEGCPFSFDYKEVILDRPFVYAIMHKETGLPVFTGIVNVL